MSIVRLQKHATVLVTRLRMAVMDIYIVLMEALLPVPLGIVYVRTAMLDTLVPTARLQVHALRLPIPQRMEMVVSFIASMEVQ